MLFRVSFSYRDDRGVEQCWTNSLASVGNLHFPSWQHSIRGRGCAVAEGVISKSLLKKA